MLSFIIRILGNILALYVAYLFVPGFSFTGGIKEYALAGVVLGLLNMLVKPVLRLVAMPVIILTLGLFALVINALLLWAVDYIFDFVTIADVYALALTTLVVAAVNMIIGGIAKAFK